MRIDPVRKEKNVRSVKTEELQKVVHIVTHTLAIVIAFVSVFVFFFKILYF